MKNTRAAPLLFWGLLSFYFFFIGYEVLTSEYLLTDEAFMLWHLPENHIVFNIWHSLGRSFSGWMIEWLFGMNNTVAKFKYIRLYSLLQCILTTLSLYYVLRRLQKSGLSLPDALIYCTVAFFAASLSSIIYIGWAVCTVDFIPIVLSLLAGLFLYRSLTKVERGKRPAIVMGTAAFIMGIMALFFYQTMYPFILLAFYVAFLLRKDGRFTRRMYGALLFFFVALAVYFLLFQLSMKVSHMGAADRTKLKFDPLGRLSFFFSFPLNQAFNVNAFFFARSVLSQAIMPVLLAVWVFYTFYTRRGQHTIRYLAGVIVWWILGYIPQLIASESFAPYRTMIVFSVMVFLLMGDILFSLVKGRNGTIVCFVIVVILLFRGGYVYKIYLADPLTYEYRVVRNAVRDHYTAGSREVIFIRAPENGFEPGFGIGPFKDEFGMPSTYKDWAPEGLVRQIVAEITGSRAAGEALKIAVLSGMTELSDPSLLMDPHVFVIDMPALLGAKK